MRDKYNLLHVMCINFSQTLSVSVGQPKDNGGVAALEDFPLCSYLHTHTQTHVRHWRGKRRRGMCADPAHKL